MALEIISRQPEGPARRTPVLFVHGAWHAAWCWEEHFLPYFAAHGYPAYALSLRSHGRSPGPRRGNRIYHYVADVAEAVGQLPGQPVVAGHSMGGLVVQKYLEQYPARAGILMGAVPPRGALRTFVRLLRLYPLPWVRALFTWRLYPFVETPKQVRDLFFSPDFPADQLAAYASRLEDESYWAAIDMFLLALPRPSRVKAPVMVLGGANDATFYTDEVEATARAYGVQPVIVPGLAHDSMLETRWQVAADRILQWLDTLVPDPSHLT